LSHASREKKRKKEEKKEERKKKEKREKEKKEEKKIMLRGLVLKYICACRCLGDGNDEDPTFKRVESLITNVACLWSDSGVELNITLQDCLRVILVSGIPKERLVQPGLPCDPTSCYLFVNGSAPNNFENLFEGEILELSRSYLYCVIFHMMDFIHRETGFCTFSTDGDERCILELVKKEKRCACETLTPKKI
jgi:hypothetical protein